MKGDDKKQTDRSSGYSMSLYNHSNMAAPLTCSAPVLQICREHHIGHNSVHTSSVCRRSNVNPQWSPYNYWICLWRQKSYQNFCTDSTLPMLICAVHQLQTVLTVRTFEGTENLRVQNAGSLLHVHQLWHHPILYSIMLFQSENCSTKTDTLVYREKSSPSLVSSVANGYLYHRLLSSS